MLAILITLRYVRDGLPFNMGRWAFMFPIGVYSVATLSLGRMTGVHFFVQLGALFVLTLTAFWLIVTGRTLHGAYHGHLFVSPCLSDGTGLELPSAAPLSREMENVV